MTKRLARHLPFLAWSALAFTVLFWRLGAASFWDPDEAHYAQTTRELITTGNWLTPYYNDQPFFDKPILFHWLQAVPMGLLGSTETAARLVPALAALAIVGFTWWLGAALVSSEVGFAAALLLTVNPALVALARYAILDTVFTVFLFGGLATLTVAMLRDRPRLQWSGYAFVGLATFTKGPIALALCASAVVLLVVLSGDMRRRLVSLRWALGVIVILLVSVPWFAYMWYQHRWTFLNAYFLDENLRLFSGSRFANAPPWWFYLQVVATGLLPWTAMLAGRLYDDLRAMVKGRRLDSVEIALWLWPAAVIGLFSTSSFKLDHYVFPAAPALCLLCARAWQDSRQGNSAETAAARWGARLVGLILIIVGIVLSFLMIERLDLPRPALIVPLVLLACGVADAADRFWERRPAKMPWIAVSAMTAIYIGALVWVVPAFEEQKVVKDLARWVGEAAGSGDQIAAYRLNRWSATFRFYVGRHVVFLETPDVTRFIEGPGRVYCIMPQPEIASLESRGAHLQIVQARSGMSVTSGMALWREKSAAARYVVVTHAEPRHKRGRG